MLQRDPSTGLFVDPATGRAFVDAAGTQLSTDPGLTAQATRSLQISNGLYSKLAGFQQNYNQAQAGQTQLGTALGRQIKGEGPSVAATELAAAQDNIARQQQSEAAGATGQNAALARYAAMQNTADAQAKTAAAGASLRAQEVAQAEQAKGNVLANQANEANQGYGTTVSGVNGASAVAGNTQGQQSTIDEQNSAANKALIGNLASAGGAALTKVATSDKREKKDIEAVSDADMKKLLDRISTFSFDYKHPGTEGEAPGSRVGVMAQDLEKGGPLGKSVVVDGNVKKLDIPNGIGVALAAVAALHRRLNAIETKKAA